MRTLAERELVDVSSSAGKRRCDRVGANVVATAHSAGRSVRAAQWNRAPATRAGVGLVSFTRMVAAMSIVTGRALGMADYARMAREAIEGWLRGYEGYRGLIVFTDEDGQRGPDHHALGDT